LPYSCIDAPSPVVERWGREAAAEEEVGAILDRLRERGWRALHGVDSGRGNIDHVLIGPAGVLTVETKSHRGRLEVGSLHERMLRQAYAQAKLETSCRSHPSGCSFAGYRCGDRS